MPGKLEQLAQEMDALRKVKDSLLAKLDDAMRLPDAKKKELWDAVVPIVKARVYEKIDKGSELNWTELRQVIVDKTVEVVFGMPGTEFYDTLQRF